jgi:hypothetical protein
MSNNLMTTSRWVLLSLTIAANNMFIKKLFNNFLQKLILTTKPRRHKGKIRSIFSTSCLRAFLAKRIFRSEAAENFFFYVICKELEIYFMSAS